MRKLNIPLITGLIIVSGIMFLILFGEYYSPHDASVGEESVWVQKDNGEREFLRAPLPPSRTYLLGTDSGGRDILSVIMAGAKNTFFIAFLATILRFLLAVPIAYFAAFGEKISKRLIVIFSTIFSAIPSLVICVMILKANAISELSLWPSMLAFLIVFTIVGWGRLASTMEEKINDVLKQDFIQGEVAIGKSKFAIAIRNVLPHIMPSIIIHIFLEIALVLLLLAQLGVFEVFVGNKQVYAVKTLGNMSRTNFNFFPEWGAMLAATKRSIRDNNFWLSIYPIIAFSISIIGFNLLGQGLNHELNKRNSRFISNAKKLWDFLSPATFASEIKNFKKKKRVVILKISAIVVILTSITVPVLGKVFVEDSNIMVHVEELNKDEYEGRLIGTQGHDRAAEYIAGKLKEYNIDPLFDGSYISEFNINPASNLINDSKFTVSDNSDIKINEFKFGIDYYIEAWPSVSIGGLKGEILTSVDFISGNFDPLKDYFIILNPRKIEYSLVDQIENRRREYKNIKGVLIPDSKKMNYTSGRIELEEKGLVKILDEIDVFKNEVLPARIQIGKRMANLLWEMTGDKIEISTVINETKGLTGKNIGGIIKGRSMDNPIILAASYDYLGFHDMGTNLGSSDIVKYKGLYENGTSIAGNLELAKNLGDINKTPARSIIFIFIDGSNLSNEGILDFDKYGIFDKKPLIIFSRYVGITKWDRKEDSIYHYTVQSGSDSGIENEFYRWLRRNAAKKDYFIMADNNIREKSLGNLDNKDVTGIVLQGLDEIDVSWHIGMEQSDMGEIDVDRLRTHVQYLLDTISDMAYGRRWIK